MNNAGYNFDKLKGVIFDFDGTLLDSFKAHYEVYETVFAKFDIKIEMENYLATYSPNWYETYKAVGLPEDKWALADNLWIDEAKRKRINIYYGIKEILSELNEKFSLGIVTSGSKSRVERDLNNNGIRGFFKTIITGDDVINPKPDPEGLEKALLELKLEGESAVYIGDANDDFKMAHSAGVDFIGVKSDFVNLNTNHPDYKVYSIYEIPIVLSLKT